MIYLSTWMENYQFELEVGERRVLHDVESGTHTIEARIGPIVVAAETFDHDAEVSSTVADR